MSTIGIRDLQRNTNGVVADVAESKHRVLYRELTEAGDARYRVARVIDRGLTYTARSPSSELVPRRPAQSADPLWA